MLPWAYATTLSAGFPRANRGFARLKRFRSYGARLWRRGPARIRRGTLKCVRVSVRHRMYTSKYAHRIQGSCEHGPLFGPRVLAGPHSGFLSVGILESSCGSTS